MAEQSLFVRLTKFIVMLINANLKKQTYKAKIVLFCNNFVF